MPTELKIDKSLFTLSVPEDIEELLKQLEDYLKDTGSIFSKIAPLLKQILISDIPLTSRERIAIVFLLRRMK